MDQKELVCVVNIYIPVEVGPLVAVANNTNHLKLVDLNSGTYI